MSERPGVVDLRDLQHRYMWDPRSIAAFVAAAGLEVELRARYPTQPIAGDEHSGAIEAVPIPGTRNILEIAPRFLRVI